jgi:putative NADH-flavin reductase
MRIAIFGANGSTGRLMVRRALERGDDVAALTRHPDAFPITHERLRVVGGDVADAGAVAAVVANADAVLSSIGVPYRRSTITVYSTAAERIVAAMRSHGVRRLAVTSSSATEPHEPTEGWLFERVLQPMIANGIGRTTYDDMRRMEAIVAASGLDWTIARPSGLFTPASSAPTAYRVTAAHSPGRFTSRTDLADFLLEQARGTEWIGARPEVHTDEGAPSIVSVIWNEGIRRRPEPAA